ncbi:hypothetical protein ACFQHO_24960 [Actinomadura yumaensis]
MSGGSEVLLRVLQEAPGNAHEPLYGSTPRSTSKTCRRESRNVKITKSTASITAGGVQWASVMRRG